MSSKIFVCINTYIFLRNNKDTFCLKMLSNVIFIKQKARWQYCYINDDVHSTHSKLLAEGKHPMTSDCSLRAPSIWPMCIMHNTFCVIKAIGLRLAKIVPCASVTYFVLTVEVTFRLFHVVSQVTGYARACMYVFSKWQWITSMIRITTFVNRCVNIVFLSTQCVYIHYVLYFRGIYTQDVAYNQAKLTYLARFITRDVSSFCIFWDSHQHAGHTRKAFSEGQSGFQQTRYS